MASDLQGAFLHCFERSPIRCLPFGSHLFRGCPGTDTSQALTLLEYLVKHGSERVVDDARAHVSTIKMLRSFHYIDEKGKDQGINGESVLGVARP